MLQEVIEFIKKNQMIRDHDHVVIGVSGGADSMCLLNIMWKLQEEYQLMLKAVHIHHGIRGKEADEDAAYVQKICGQIGIPCEVFYFNMEKEATDRKVSIEEAGRMIRYDVFHKVAEKMGGGKIAVAHHMNDQVETILMRLFRGTGSKGLGGMKAIRDGVIRPLLCVSRKQIEEYCQKQNISYQQDYTNEMTIYTRNKIRLDLIPYIQQEFNPNIVERLYQTGILLQEQEAYMEMQTKEMYSRIVESKGSNIVQVSIKGLCRLHPAMQKRILRMMVNRILNELNEIQSKHIEDILQLMDKESGKQIHLPKGIVVQKQYDQLQFSFMKIGFQDFSYELNVPDQKYISEMGQNIKIELVHTIGQEKIALSYEKNYTKSFDYDKIRNNLEFRTRKPGDFIKLKGMRGTKKLKDFFIDMKIPREERNQIPLLTDGRQVIWIVGFRINKDYEVTSATRNVMNVTLST